MGSDNIYFIRHQPDKGETDHLYRLLEQNRIAICFDNHPWELRCNETQKSGRSAVGMFEKITGIGAYVFAEYSCGIDGEGKKGLVLYRVRKGAKVGPCRIPKKDDPGFLINKTIECERIRKLYYGDFPVLLAARPIRGTVCQPSRKIWQGFVDLFAHKKEMEIDIKYLHPKMAEKICEKYLREEGVGTTDGKRIKLDYCILGTGGGLKCFDIVGRATDGKKIFAQVKNSTLHKNNERNNVCDEMKRHIKNYDGCHIILLFKPDGKSGKSAAAEEKNVIFFDVGKVFDHYFKTNKTMIADVLGISSEEVA